MFKIVVILNSFESKLDSIAGINLYGISKRYYRENVIAILKV